MRADEFPELVLHVGKLHVGASGVSSFTWHVVRRENLSTWVMPRGDGEEGVPGAALPLRQGVAAAAAPAAPTSPKA